MSITILIILVLYAISLYLVIRATDETRNLEDYKNAVSERVKYLADRNTKLNEKNTEYYFKNLDLKRQLDEGVDNAIKLVEINDRQASKLTGIENIVNDKREADEKIELIKELISDRNTNSN